MNKYFKILLHLTCLSFACSALLAQEASRQTCIDLVSGSSQSNPREQLFDGNGVPKEEFLGMNGFANFAEKYYQSKMRLAFDKTSAVLSKREMDKLGWQTFYGTAHEFRVTRSRIVDENGNLREEFLGMEGYVSFAEKYHESRMHPAFVNISAVLSKREMDELGWQGFQGTVHEYRVTRSRIVDENGNLREEFLGMEGHIAFAEQYHESRMHPAFVNISALLSKKEMDELGWQKFQGTAHEYRVTRNRIVDENGNLREEFLGMEGYAAFADQYHDSRMQQAFINTSAVLSKREMDELNWQSFHGTVSEYRVARNRIIDENENFREEFLGMEGYVAFAVQYHDSRMQQAFINTSAVLSKREMDELGWQGFHGTVSEYRITRNRIIDENGKFREGFLGMEGYAAFAKEYHESRMHPAFINISAVLSKKEMDELGWQGFHGTVTEYRATRSRIMDRDGNLREEFLGMEGYANFAKKYYESRMKQPFQNISAVFEQEGDG